MIASDAPNVWSFLSTLATIVGGLATPIVAWYLSKHAKQATRIETLVNGNLHREQEETKRLRALLEQNGIDHTT